MALKDPLKINRAVELQNRLVMAPLVSHTASTEGRVTDAMLEHYRIRATGPGLVIVEASAVSHDGRLTPQTLVADHDSEKGLAELAKAIRSQGAVPGIQLAHAGAKLWGSPDAGPPLSPSGMRCSPTPLLPRIVNRAEIARIVKAFQSAALIADLAGFKYIEIHAAHYYLLNQFMSPVCNQRRDEYGGDIAGRLRFTAEVINAVRTILTGDTVLAVRINGHDAVPGGQSQEEIIRQTTIFREIGVDVINVSACPLGRMRTDDIGPFLLTTSQPAGKMPAGAFIEYATEVNFASGLPVIGVGKLDEPGAAEAAVAGGCDLAAVGRGFIADPEFGLKLLSGREDEIVRCQRCSECLKSLGEGASPVRCAVRSA